MALTLPRSAAPGQGYSNSQPSGDEGKSVSLRLMRAAIDESGVKHEAIAAEMGLPNAAYLSRMLSGEKPWTLRHIEALPDGIEAIYYRMRSESLGLVVAEPVDFETARRHLVSGLLGVLAPRLPAKADAMVSASLPAEKRRRA